MFKEQIAALLATIKQKQAEMAAIITKAMSERGETPNEVEEKQVKALEDELKALNVNLNRLQDLEKASTEAAQTAKPVEGQSIEQGIDSIKGVQPVIETPSHLEKGIGFAQYARAKMIATLEAKNHSYVSPEQVAKHYGFGQDVQDLAAGRTKATTLTTTGANTGATLVQQSRLASEFIELLRAKSVITQMTGFRAVPFKSTIPSQTGGGTANWVGEGVAKPVTNQQFGEVEIKEHKLAAITVYTQELMRRSDPAVDVLVRDDLIDACATLIDTTFLGTHDADANKPVGIFNGVAAIANTGTTAAAYEADLQELVESFVSANLSTDGAYWVMSETRAMRLSMLRDALGRQYFEGMALYGQRSLMGLPVVASETVGNKIGLIKTSEILMASDAGVDVSYSDQAQIVDGETTHNLWQENKLAIRAERFITWAKRRPIAAAWIDYTPAG